MKIDLIYKMKKIIVLFMTIFMLFTLSGCSETETYDNGVPTYFLEPEGYVIAEIDYDSGGLFYMSAYGYISNEDYESFLNGDLSGTLIVKHPYENNKEVNVPVNRIINIEIGIYQDLRGW